MHRASQDQDVLSADLVHRSRVLTTNSCAWTWKATHKTLTSTMLAGTGGNTAAIGVNGGRQGVTS